MAEPAPEDPAPARRTGARATRARLAEPVPARETPIPEEDGVARVVADNPSAMTYHGTNTWLIETGEGVVLLDPGPDDDRHLRALIAHGAGRITHLLVSHWHTDHVALAPRLSRALGLPIHAHPGLIKSGVAADVPLADGDRVAGLAVVATPGHSGDHLCFAREDGLLFTADHVMGWSTSVVPPPPNGSATEYLDSLRRVRDRGDRKLMCGHGPVVTEPVLLLDTLILQRRRRERQVAALVERGPVGLDALMGTLYPALRPGLDQAARANVLGHLARLEELGAAEERDGEWHARAPAPTTPGPD